MSDPATDPSNDAPAPGPIVGIGASAGGVEALQAFFGHMPADSGTGFVVVLHLAPDRESALDDILAQKTDMPVQQAQDGMAVAANHVYVTPAGAHLTIEDGRLRLSEPPAERLHSSIDGFFRALAADQGDNAVAVVLSGTGTDGTVGLREIHKQGGVALVQDPEEAAYDGMPRSALATGIVDRALPVAELAETLVEYRDQAGTLQLPDAPDELGDVGRSVLQNILSHLQAATGRDFSHYKRSTLLRRLQRRLKINGLASLDEYLAFLKEHDEEAERLRKDLLITVTSFFRDPEAFEALERQVIPKLFEGTDANDEVRVWVPGCASGEEAYSLAMLLAEHADTMDAPPDIQIFATDVDEQSIEIAREGRYPAPIKNDISPERIRRFFDDKGTYYQVDAAIRDLLLFAKQDLLTDPPFSNLDLVSCRNVLIYLNEEARERVFNVLHYALTEGGYLFLGRAEAGSRARSLFEPVTQGDNLFRARATASPPPRRVGRPLDPTEGIGAGLRGPTTPEPTEVATGTAKVPEGNAFSEELHRRALMADTASVLVNEARDVVHLSEEATRFLEFGEGTPSDDLVSLVPPELRDELRTALYEAFENSRSTRRAGLEATVRGEPTRLDVSVQPVLNGERPTHVRIELEESSQVHPDGNATEAPDSGRVEELQAQLRRTREQLQTTSNEHDAAVQQLKMMNEELQSKNEELEVSRQKLQSVNEELTTTNDELKHKIEELRAANSALVNLMEATRIATLFLDTNLRIQRFSPETTELFNLQPIDEGRPIADFTQRFEYEGLIDDAQTVLDDLDVIERELHTSEDKYFVARLRPYRTVSDTIQGVVLTFVDITERKHAEEQLRKNEAWLSNILEQLPIAVGVIDPDGTFELQNDKMEAIVNGGRLPSTDPDQHDVWVGTDDNGERLPPEEWPGARALRGEEVSEGVVFRLGSDDASTWINVAAVPLRDEDEITGAIVTIEDITDLVEARQKVREERDFLDGVLRTVGTPVMVLDREGSILRVNEAFEDTLGYSEEAVTGQEAVDVLLAADLQDEIRGVLDDIRAGEDPISGENDVFASDGTRRRIRWTTTALRDEDGTVTHFITSGLDVTERRELEQDLADADERIRRQIGQDLHDTLSSELAGLAMIAESLRQRLEDKGIDEADRMDDIVRIARESADTSRTLSHSLVPVGLQEETLATALAQLCTEQDDLYAPHVHFEGDAEETLPADPETATQMYRIAQEGVTNAVRHADGTEVAVALRREADRLVLTIRDDGRGLPDDIDEAEGLGLRSMQYRSNLIGGRLALESPEAGGTRVRFELPLDKATEG